MKKILLMAVLLVGFVGFVVLAEEAKGGKDAKKAEQTFKEGDTGTVTGTIEKIEKGRVTIKDGDKSITVFPKFVEGKPEKEIMEKVEKLKVGDKVKVEWAADKEHQRIKSIDKAE